MPAIAPLEREEEDEDDDDDDDAAGDRVAGTIIVLVVREPSLPVIVTTAVLWVVGSPSTVGAPSPAIAVAQLCTPMLSTAAQS